MKSRSRDCNIFDVAQAQAGAASVRWRRFATEHSRRAGAGRAFTVADSVDELLAVVRSPRAPTPWAVIQELETLVRLPSANPDRERPTDDDRLVVG